MMQNFKGRKLGGDRVKGDDDLPLNTSSALQSLRLRLGLEGSPSLGNRLESQEDALQNLSHRDWTIRVGAIRILAASGKQEFVKPLTALLLDENVAVREAVVKALGELGGKASVDPLVSCLKDEDWSVRATAVQSLGRLGEIAPIEPLVASLEDEDVSVRLATVRALEKQAKRVPLDVFVTALGDKEEFVRRAAMEVMEGLLEHPEQCMLNDTLVDALIEKAGSEESDVRLAAVRFLGKLTTYAFTKGAYAIQGAKIVCAALPWTSKEQRGQSLAESSLFLPRNKVMHPGMAEYYTPFLLHVCLHACGWNSSFGGKFSTVPQAMKCSDVFLRTPSSYYEFECKVVSKTAERGKFFGWKDCLRYSEFGKQINVWQTQNSSTAFLILLYSAESSLEELRRSTWSIFGASDFEKEDFLVRLLLLLFRSQRDWSRLYQLTELLLSRQSERWSSIELPGGISLLSLGNAIGSQLSMVTKAHNKDAEPKESLVPLVQNESAGSRVPLYTPMGLYQGSVPTFR